VARDKAAPDEIPRRQETIVERRPARRFIPERDRRQAIGHPQFTHRIEIELRPLHPMRARRFYWQNMAEPGQSAVANCRARNGPLAGAPLIRQAKADVALALDLLYEFDLPAQIALACTLACIGIVRPPPAIVGRVGHRLPAG